MVFVSFLILAGPAALTWKLCDTFGYRQRERLRDVLITLIADSLLLLAGTYLIINFVFRIDVISFSPVYTTATDRTLFHPSFVWKYAAVSCILSAMLAVFKLAVQKIKQLRGNHHEKNT